MLTVHRVTPSGGRTFGFGPRIECADWREASEARKRIAASAIIAKDEAFPVVYDAAGNFVVSGWQKGG